MRKYRAHAELRPHFDGRDMICVVKQQVWARYQRPLLQAHEAAAEYVAKGLNLSVTVDYDSFRSHPAWLDQGARARLKIKSTNCAAVKLTPNRTARNLRRWKELASAASDADAAAEAQAGSESAPGSRTDASGE
eukprot:5796536-Prymnesium_polylepis.1